MTPKRRIGCGFVWLAIIVAVLPIVYLLSLGPVAWLMMQVPLDEDGMLFRCIVAYCYPANSLAQTGYINWMEHYIRWWAE